MEAFRRSLAAFIGLLLIVWIVPAMLDWNRYRTEIADFAAAELGRPVSIGGGITLKLLPRALLTAADVTFPDQGDGVSARLHALRLEVAILPLLRGRLVVRDLVLGAPALTLPWPLPPDLGTPVRPYVRHPFTARVEDGSVAIGAVAVTSIDAALQSDAATGALHILGAAALAGAPWRFATTLGAPDAGGRAALDIGIDGQAAYQGTHAHLGGSLSAGLVTGQVEGSGPDIAGLIAAPHGPWHASGPFAAAAGLLALPALEFAGAGTRAAGHVQLHITKPAGLDLSLLVHNLDASLWATALYAMPPPALPVHLTLDVADLALLGGDVRRLHVALALDGANAAIEQGRATLPGGAALAFTGQAARGTDGISLHGPASLEAPDLNITLAWLHPLAPTLIGPLPGDRGSSARITGLLHASPHSFSVSGLAGTLHGATISGGFGIGFGPRPGFGMGLSLSHLALDGFGGALALPDFDGDIFVRIADTSWHGGSIGALDAALHSAASGMTLRRLTLEGTVGKLSLTGTLGADFRLSDVHAAASTQDVAALAAAATRFGFPAHLLQPGVWQGGAKLEMNAAGPSHAIRAQLRADTGDLRTEAELAIDAAAPSLNATVTIRHPGAPRLLAALGAPQAERWLDNGSLALLTQLSATAGHLHIANLDITAASLRASAQADADFSGAVPVIDAKIAADTLPLPWREKLPAAWLQGWNGVLHISAEHVLADLQPIAHALHTDITVQNGAILADPLTAAIGEGSVTGQAAMDLSQTPARAAAHLDFTAVAMPEATTGLRVDIGSGTLSGTADVDATGEDSRAWLPSCSGSLALQISGAAVAGLDLPRVTHLVATHRLSPKPLTAALSAGTSPNMDGTIAGTIDHGRLTLGPTTLTSPAGTLTLAGTLGLDGSAADIGIAVTPDAPSPPPIHLHVSGPWATSHLQADIGRPPRGRPLRPKDLAPSHK
jgi:hypothetical protein